MAIRTFLLSGFLTLALILGPTAGPGRAQGDLFAPAIYVNDRVITRYEVAQSRLFVTALRQPGDPDKVAVERLVDDALRRDAAQAAGITLTPEQLDAGMTEFAARANMSAEQFLQALQGEGIAPETFRAFVEAGLLWREVVRTRFAPRVQISDAEIDRAMASASRDSGVQVLISELVLRADSPAAAAEAEAVANRLAGRTMSEGAFAAEARARSVSGSRGRGGRLDWLPLGNLPPPVAAQVLGLAPGQVSQPFPVPNAVILFFMRDLRETGLPEQAVLALDWAEFDVASAAEAARVRAEVDTCDDLYGVAKGLPPERLRRETRKPAEIPGDVAMELAQLDDNEGTAGYARAGHPVFLMLCARSHDLPGAAPGTPLPAEGEAAETAAADAEAAPTGPTRAQVREQLMNQRLTAYAEGYLAELRADATIRYQ